MREATALPVRAAATEFAETAITEAVVLAFDFGTRRIGAAIGNTVTGQARPLATIDAAGDQRWTQIARLLDDWRPARLVVGIARHRDGSAHQMTQRCERFARQLEGRFRLPVERVDERYSSVEAAARGADRNDIDAAAAAVILQEFLDRARN
jgi:putative Holliday junction resolvase